MPEDALAVVVRPGPELPEHRTRQGRNSDRPPARTAAVRVCAWGERT
ncbi:hypothetical protein [Streptomyces sp. MST-110588]|nr:hypothetical protein [Streptomyces sp. MST-110588]UNO41961.1 hypothetical protein KGS77_23485 [Streptomyces sp. MST-110588]